MDETTPEEEYAEPVLHVSLTTEQAGVIVFCLMEQSKALPVPQQMEWTRLALGLNDAIVEARDGGAESG